MTLADSASGAGSVVVTIIIAIIGFGLYWLPTIIAAFRRLPHIGPTAIMNLFAFVIVPWWLALMMAVRTQPRPQYVVPGGWGPQQPLPPQGYWPQPDIAPIPAPPVGPVQPPQAGLERPHGYQ